MAKKKKPVAKKKTAAKTKLVAKKSAPKVKASAKKKSGAKKSGAKKSVKKKSTKKSSARPESLEKFISRLEGWQKDIVNALRGIIRTIEQEATEGVKWAQPVFELNGPFAFIRPAAKHVTFGFWRGAELRDPYNKLEGDGSKMKHVKLKSSNDAVLPSIIDYVRQAVQLNREKGDPTQK